MDYKYCIKCGSQISEDAFFCAKCGSIVANDREKTYKAKRIIPLIAAVLCLLAIILFFLPFCSLSCNGETYATPSALNLVAGKLQDVDGDMHTFDAQPAVILLIVLPVAAACAVFLKNHLWKNIVHLSEGILIVIFSIVIFSIVKDAAAEEMLTTQGSTGFILYQIHGGLMILLGGTGILLYFLTKKDRTKQYNDKKGDVIMANQYCRYCGNRIQEGTRFCNECGKPIKQISLYSDKQNVQKNASTASEHSKPKNNDQPNNTEEKTVGMTCKRCGSTHITTTFSMIRGRKAKRGQVSVCQDCGYQWYSKGKGSNVLTIIALIVVHIILVALLLTLILFTQRCIWTSIRQDMGGPNHTHTP